MPRIKKSLPAAVEGPRGVFDLFKPTEPLPPPLIMAVGDLRRIGGNDLGSSLYVATFKVGAYHLSEEVLVFRNVLMLEEPAEEPGKVFVALLPEQFQQQMPNMPTEAFEAVNAFSSFLMEESQKRINGLGLLSRIFAGGECYYQCKALAIYAEARRLDNYSVGVAYRPNDSTDQAFATVERDYFGFGPQELELWPYAEFEAFFESHTCVLLPP